MSKALAVVVTGALLAVDARAWVLANREGIEGLWVILHLLALSVAAPAAWAWVNIESFEVDAAPRRGGRR